MAANSPAPSSSSSSIAMEPSSDTSPYDVEELLASKRGRGRGGGRGRGRGRGRGEAVAGASGASGRGRGKGRGGRRGRRKQTGVIQLTEEEIEGLQEQHDRRLAEGEAMVDDLSEEDAKTLLKEVLKKQPLLVLDLAQALQEAVIEPEGPGPDPDHRPARWPEWCVCTNCREMRTDAASVCCRMRPELCHSTMALMRLVITDPGVLQVQQLYRNDMFARHATTEEDVNKSLRHAAYRQYILTQFGRLGQGVRRPVPSCCTIFIRGKFPDPNGVYVDYVPSW